MLSMPSSLSSISIFLRFGLLMVSQRPCMFHSHFVSIFSLSLPERSNFSTLSSWPNILFSPYSTLLARLSTGFLRKIELLSFSFPEFQFDFFSFSIFLLNSSLISCIVFLILFSYLFVVSFNSSRCLHMSSLILLIILIIVLLSSLF
jgi:hypothetical protein